MMIGNSILLGLAVVISAVTTITIACPESSVTLYLYTGKNGNDKPCKLSADSCPAEACDFNPNSRTVIIIHSWMGSYLDECPKVIKNAYVEKMLEDSVHVNVIVVDFSPCNADFSSTVSWTKEIGQAAAKTISHLAHQCELDIKLVECIGFGLGAHVCGTLSDALSPNKLHRIIGLEPLKPTIETYPSDSRLDKSDGRFVCCIHASSKFLSITDAFCDSDIYPNGASNQYGCGDEMYQLLAGGCDYMKACEIFANSVLDPTMFPLHKECDNADQALTNTCIESPSVLGYMGDNNDGPSGIFWVNSTSCYMKKESLVE